MKIGDMVQWRDQRNYPGLCGIVTKESPAQSVGASLRGETREIFVHWTNFPKDYGVGAGWEKVSALQLLSTGEIK